MSDRQLAEELRHRASTMNGAQPVGAGDGHTYVLGYYGVPARALDQLAADAPDAKDKRIAELEAALAYLRKEMRDEQDLGVSGFEDWIAVIDKAAPPSRSIRIDQNG